MAPQREWFEQDYYKVLGVSSSAWDKEIKEDFSPEGKDEKAFEKIDAEISTQLN